MAASSGFNMTSEDFPSVHHFSSLTATISASSILALLILSILWSFAKKTKALNVPLVTNENRDFTEIMKRGYSEVCGERKNVYVLAIGSSGNSCLMETDKDMSSFATNCSRFQHQTNPWSLSLIIFLTI